MEADLNGTAPQPLEHVWRPWGEHWQGTKAQLQAIGIGVGLSFPGEGGVTARSTIHTKDRRGVSVDIQYRHWGAAGQYLASSNYRPGARKRAEVNRRNALAVALDHGVMQFRHQARSDEYVGTGPALVALGLVRADELPGAPGKGKTMVTFDANGARTPQGSNGDGRPGGRQIFRRGRARFALLISLPVDVSSDRRAADKRFDDEQDVLDLAAMQVRRAFDIEWHRRQDLANDLSIRRAPVARVVDRRITSGWSVITNAAPLPAAGAGVPASPRPAPVFRLVRGASEPVTTA